MPEESSRVCIIKINIHAYMLNPACILFLLIDISGIKTKPRVYSKKDQEKYKEAYTNLRSTRKAYYQTDRIKRRNTQSNKENASGLQAEFMLLGPGATQHSLELKAAHEEVPLDT